jgi:hypothetical protein
MGKGLQGFIRIMKKENEKTAVKDDSLAPLTHNHRRNTPLVLRPPKHSVQS